MDLARNSALSLVTRSCGLLVCRASVAKRRSLDKSGRQTPGPFTHDALDRLRSRHSWRDVDEVHRPYDRPWRRSVGFGP